MAATEGFFAAEKKKNSQHLSSTIFEDQLQIMNMQIKIRIRTFYSVTENLHRYISRPLFYLPCNT